MNKKLLVLTSLLGIIIPVGIAFGNEPKVLYDQCYLSKLRGVKIGYTCVVQKLTQNSNKNLIMTERKSEQQFQRFGFTVKITQDMEFVEDDQGKPVSFSAKVNSPGEDVDIKGEFLSPNKVLLTSTVNGSRKTREVALKKKILFPYAIDKMFKDNPNTETIEYSTVDPSTSFKVISVSAKKIGPESISEGDLNGTYNKYKVSMDFLPGISNYEWLDKDGHLVKEKLSLLDLEDIAVAKDQINVAPEKLDILTQTLIPVTDEIPDPSKLDNISYKIETQNIDTDNFFPSDSRQRVIQVKDNSVYLKIKGEKPDDENYSYPVSIKGKAEFLKTGPFIVTTDDKIKAQASILVGQDKDAYQIAKRMEKWVYDTITKKDFAINFANSSQVIKSKEGDCTEHAILLASLLRAAGIPSKVAVGLIYTDTPQKAFGYHMWVKAYIGKWISLDPSFPTETFLPTHIELSESALNSLDDRTDAVLNLIRSISNLKINVINYSASAILNIDLSKKSAGKPEKVDIREILKGKESPIKKISVKKQDNLPILSIETSAKNQEDYTRSAIYNFSQGNIVQSREDLEKASQFIAFNDDYSTVNQAIREASLGFFSLADKRLKTLHDSDIWDNQISNIKHIYFPKLVTFIENENILANALSKVDFQNNPNGAISLIESNKDAFVRNDFAYYILAKSYFAKNDLKNAVYYVNKAIRINPVNSTYKFELAKYYIKQKSYSKAKGILTGLLNSEITDRKFIELVNTELNWLKSKTMGTKDLYYLAKYHASKGDFQVATDALNRSIKEKKRDSSVYVLLGDIYYQLNDNNKARINYNEALRNDSSAARALWGLGNLLLSQGKDKEALEQFIHAYKLDPNSEEISLSIANTYDLLSQDEYAYKYYTQVLRLNANNPKANYKIGLMYLNQDNFDKASAMFKKALSINSSYSECWLELAKLEIRKKNLFLAKSYLIPVNRINSESPDYYYYLGLICKNNENFSEARINFKKAIELKNDYKEAENQLKELE